MEVLGIVFAGIATVIVVYLVVYTLPTLVRKAARAIKKKRQPASPKHLDTDDTYEIYVSLRAA